MLFATTPATFAATQSNLQWGRPQVARRTHESGSAQRSAGQAQPAHTIHDTHVVTAAWEEETQQSAFMDTGREDRSVVVERAAPDFDLPAYDPFEEDDREVERLAQLSDDPFDEPAGEELPAPQPDDMLDENLDESLDDVEAAIEDEIERRGSEEDLFDQDMTDVLEDDPLKDTLEEDPLEDDLFDNGAESDAFDESDDDLFYNDDTDLDELLQPKSREGDTPDLEFDLKNEADELTEEERAQQLEEREQERLESEENCREEIAQVEADRISSIDLNIRVEGNAGEDFPHECSISSKIHQPRQWPEITYNWKASALCHKPLYFEQVQLERYGHSWGPYVQPIMSGVHFFGTIPILPYKMGIRTPTECVYTLGYYRPGSCAPYMIDPVPFTWRAALYQGGVTTGISFIIP